MTFQETLLAKLNRLPESEQNRLLQQIEQWLQETIAAHTVDIARALAAVERTWASIPLGRETTRWIAESKELEYDAG